MTELSEEFRPFNIYYRVECGEVKKDEPSPLIFFIHGTGGDTNHFNIVTPGLTSKGFRVLLMDVRYHGLSQPKNSSDKVKFHFSDVVEDMYYVLKKVKAEYYPNNDIPLVIAGLSMGGMISMLFAKDMEENKEKWEKQGFLLKGLVAMASGVPCMELERPGWDVYRDRTATPEVLQMTKASIIASALTESGKQETERELNLISDAALYECLVEVATFFPPPSNPPKPYIPGSRTPILLILPDHDLYTKAEMEKLNEVNLELGIVTKLVNVKDSGHMVVLDQGEIVAYHIYEFSKLLSIIQ